MSRSRRFLFPLLLLAVALAIALSAHAAEPSKEVRKTLPFPAGGRVEIDTYKRSVDLVAEERPDVLVEARVTADTECGSAEDQAEWVEKTEVRIDTFGKTIRIESDYSRLSAHHQGFLSWCTARPFVAYRIRMPKTAAFELDADAGRRGDFRSEFGSSVRTTGRLRTSLNGGGPKLALSTHKGTLKLAAR